MIKSLLLVVLCCALPALSVAAKPDFSGAWNLDLSSSDLGPIPAPKAMNLNIVQRDPDLTVITTIKGGPQGDLKYEAKYSTDGKETVNRLSGHDARCTAAWDGQTLVVQTAADFGGGTVHIQSRWNLLNDGNVLRQSAHIATAQGGFDTTYVFDRATMR